MSKYFSATARHAKAQEFLELRQGTMTVMEYMARFTELARFGNDYVATDMAKVRRFENGLKLSIRGKIVGPSPTEHELYGRDNFGHRERERDGGRIGHSRCECRWEEEGGSTFFEFGKETEDLCPTSAPGTGPARADDMLLLLSAWTYEVGLPTEVWIPGFWADAVPVIIGTGADTVYSSTPQYGSKEPILVVECYTSTFGSTNRSEGSNYGSRSGTGLTDQDFGDSGACLRRCTTS